MTTTTATIALPEAAGGWREIELRQPRAWAEHPDGFRSRVVFAAAHVVPDPRADNVPGAPAAIDWDATLAFRRHLFRYGLGVAEAMDTAQRNMGLDWPATQELITRSAAIAREHGARIASGAGTDQLLGPAADINQVTRPVILHWLGEMFDPQLSGYWGSTEVAIATRSFLDLVREHSAKVDGVKVSLLSADHE